MKKLFLILLLLVFCTIAFSQEESTNWFKVLWGFQLGWVPLGNLEFSHLPEKSFFAPFDTVFKVDTTTFDFVKIGGQCTTLFSLTGEDDTAPINFRPTGMTYMVYAGIEPIRNIIIKWEHSCSHPVLWYLPTLQSAQFFSSEYDRIYLEISGALSF